MKLRRHISISLTVLLVSCAPARADEQGGYYWSLKHPGFGKHVESQDGYQRGDGYYGSIEDGSYYTKVKHSKRANNSSPADAEDQKLDQAKQAAQQAQQQLEQAKQLLEQATAAQLKAQQALSAAEALKQSPANPATPPAGSSPPVVAIPAAQSAAVTAESGPTDQLSQLEQQLFGETYKGESEDTRLARLERFVYGTSKSGLQQQRVSELVASLSSTSPVTLKSVSAPALSFDQLMKEGKSEFAQTAYHAASSTFQEATQLQPFSQDAHFWSAMAYWHLFDYDNAKSEFELVFRINPFNKEGHVAKASMLNMSAYLAKHNGPPVDSPHQLRQAITSITQDAASLQAQKIEDGQRTAAWRSWLGGLETMKTMSNTNNYINSAWNLANYYGAYPNNLDEVSSQGALKAYYIQTDAQRQALLAQIDGMQRANTIQDWSNYLISSMGERWRPGEPHLRSFGTNLYVQYYGDEDPSDPPLAAPPDPPLMARTLSYHLKKPALLQSALKAPHKPAAS